MTVFYGISVHTGDWVIYWLVWKIWGHEESLETGGGREQVEGGDGGGGAEMAERKQNCPGWLSKACERLQTVGLASVVAFVASQTLTYRHGCTLCALWAVAALHPSPMAIPMHTVAPTGEKGPG